ncbi:beta-glucosidase [Streptomyces sp. 3213]|uniref:glycoside hydrolase family 3 C-terminal domain-containing protein n=1 Tax=Streptomyces sp. 3213.3 TaxID=1855348 RepID=UPI00089B4079|nr:glycoside hydrolase family 3 C-terminal domain-containing protein [Streptomyces sp. 3213.3]SEC43614.1 beta-glucosidase [Streptomyces sp. 3213] [Streptomyces sp. 3213.3]
MELDRRSVGRHGTGLRRTALIAGVSAALIAGGTAAAPGASGAGSAGVTVKVSPRVAALIARMTLDEKLSFVHGGTDPQTLGQAGYIPGVPRLGIPELRLTDGPAGVRVNEHATAMPAPVALASSFDDGLAREFGRTVGRDGRALGQDVLLAPMTNTIRVPYAGRNFETFSEDPLLNSRMVAGEVEGVQSQGLIATVKHYAENNQEDNRMGVNVNVDEQTLRQIELPAFEAAVKAGAGAVMCSYNSVNGSHGCGSDELLDSILKEQWGFSGWVMSDWGATHATTDIVNGLDQEMPSGVYLGGELKTAITDGTIPVSELNDSVARILQQMTKFGLLDGAATRRPARDTKGGAKVAQKVAESGAVLLKNTGRALPLTGKDTSIGLIGPTAKTPKVTGGGSSSVVPDSAASPLDTITARAGRHTTVRYAAGVDTGDPIPASALSPALPVDADGTIPVTPDASFNYSGTLTVPTDGDYSFVFDLPAAYGLLKIDGNSVITGFLGSSTATVHLTAGTHSLAAGAFAIQGGPTKVRLNWVTPQAAQAAREQAVALARQVKTPVVFAYDDGTEGFDRKSLSLPADQDGLISAVADANPNTIVVLNTGSSITMPWLSKVKAVLDMYYPGENGAEATAGLLYGDVNPSGKLTQTFPASESVTPVAGDPLRYPGVDNQENYSEGIYVGYRWYDKEQAAPLFPFGYGLSYTSFAYRDLEVRQSQGTLTVSFTLKNTGTRDGAEVAQVYVGASPGTTEPQAVRSLGGYQKVRLRAGQSTTVRIRVDAQQLKYWNTSSHSWVLGTGKRDVWVGSSSRTLPLHGSVGVTR